MNVAEEEEDNPTIDLQTNEIYGNVYPFSSKVVGEVCYEALLSYRDHRKKGFRARNGEFYRVKGKIGSYVVAVLKTCVKINDNKRKNVLGEAITMTMLVRMLMYKYGNIFSKDRYNTQATDALRWLSDRLVIKVGSEWKNIPERAFGILAEGKGTFDGSIAFQFNAKGGGGGMYDCLNNVQRSMHPNGNRVPNWFQTNDQGIAPHEHFDSVTLISDAKYILILEDGYLFHLFRIVQLWLQIPVILVCSHGIPDNDTVGFVWMLQENLKLDV